jgi:D-lactate dehydrogenase (cytochrome)
VTSRVAARPPASATVEASTDADLIARYLQDAAHYPGGYASAVLRPGSIEELSASLRGEQHVIAVGAQSSLTGGATPHGDVVITTERLQTIAIRDGRVRAGAGVPLQTLQDALAHHGRWFPPVPTYLGAFVGGAISTCAAGAATFKYGTIRPWVEAISVVLAGGDILELARGQCRASEDDTFEIVTTRGTRVVRLPRVRIPDVPKCSAGYFMQPNMDLVDLFIGAEGTLGVIADATLRTAPMPGGLCRAYVPVANETAGIELVAALRAAAKATWASGEPNGIDVSAIEHLDARSIDIVRDDQVDRRLDIVLPATAQLVLLIDIELPPLHSGADAWSSIANALDGNAADAPLTRFCRLLDRHHALDDAEIALPGDRSRLAAFAELREAVPAGVNRRVAQAKQHDAAISKTAADVIVPFERFRDMMAECRRLFESRGLDLAVWGHISDGNVHPNVIPRSAEDVRAGREAILELGARVIEMGGSPLAEHGVGRNPIKQDLLRLLHGSSGIEGMRAIKASLDPQSILANGVMFPAQ